MQEVPQMVFLDERVITVSGRLPGFDPAVHVLELDAEQSRLHSIEVGVPA